MINVVIFCDEDLTGLDKTIESLDSVGEFRKTLVVPQIPNYLSSNESFSRYVKATSGDMVEVVLCDSEIGGDVCLFLRSGVVLTQEVFTYVKYFFEDSECTAVFIPVLGEGEVLPTELKDLPPGGIVDDLTLLLKYNFVCASCKKTHFLSVKNFKKVCFDEALENFGVINSISAVGEVASGFNATDLLDLFEDEVPEEFAEIVANYVDAQVVLPASETDERLEELVKIFPVGVERPAPHSAHLEKIENYYGDMLISGTLYLENVDEQIGFEGAKEFTFDRVSEIFLDEVCPRVNFRAVLPIDVGQKVEIRALFGDTVVTDLICTEECAPNYRILAEDGKFVVEKLAVRPFYKISVVVPVYNAEKYVKEAIDSVVEQSLDFFPNIQLVLADDGSTDDSLKICAELAEKYPYNIVVIGQNHKGVSAARNAALLCAMGKYVVFLDADDKLDAKLLELGTKYLEDKKNADVNFVAFPVKMFGGDDLPPTDMTGRFAKNAKIDILANPDLAQYSACGVVMRAVKGLTFDETLEFGEDAEFMCRALSDESKYAVCKDAFYNYRFTEKNDKYFDNSDWYTKTERFARAVAEFSLEKFGVVSDYAQHLLLREMTTVLSEKVGFAAEEANINAALESIKFALQYVEDSTIFGAKKISEQKKEYLLTLKYGVAQVESETTSPGFYAGECFVRALECVINVQSVREKADTLVVCGRFSLPSYDGVKLSVSFGQFETDVPFFDSNFETLYLFDKKVWPSAEFSVSVPIEEFDENIVFNLSCTDIILQTSLQTKNKFFMGKKTLITPDESTLKVSQFDVNLVKNIIKGIKKKETVAVLNEYLGMRPFFGNTRLWLFSDNSKIGEVGAVKHFYDYCQTLKDGIDKNLVLPEEIAQLTDASSILRGSPSHAVMSLFAEKIIVSDVSDIELLRNSPVAGLINADIVFIPTSVLSEFDISKISAFAEISLLVLTSEEEQRRLPAGFASEVLGNPALDALTNLVDVEKPRIIFMPNYRNDLYAGEGKFNTEFGASEYAVKIGDLLLDENLLDVADDMNVSVDFAPHGKTYLQLADFEMDESVKVVQPTFPRYAIAQKYDMLITDTLPGYDFAYLNKPIIYYQFASDGTKPADGARFGDFVEDFNKMVEIACEYMQNNFSLKSQFEAEINNFYKHRDGKSCQRIYERLIGRLKDE